MAITFQPDKIEEILNTSQLVQTAAVIVRCIEMTSDLLKRSVFLVDPNPEFTTPHMSQAYLVMCLTLLT